MIYHRSVLDLGLDHQTNVPSLENYYDCACLLFVCCPILLCTIESFFKNCNNSCFVCYTFTFLLSFFAYIPTTAKNILTASLNKISWRSFAELVTPVWMKSVLSLFPFFIGFVSGFRTYHPLLDLFWKNKWMHEGIHREPWRICSTSLL